MSSITTSEAPTPIGAYAQATRVGQHIYLAGQIGIDPETGCLVPDSLDAQVRQVFANISAVMREAGGSLSDLVSLTVYVVDLSAVAVVNAVMEGLFSEGYPARAAVAVSALPLDAQVEIQSIAVIP